MFLLSTLPGTAAMNTTPATILFVHPSDELYGADRVLLDLVDSLDRSRFHPLVVLPVDLPYAGQLSAALAKRDIECLHLPLAVLRRRYCTAGGLVRYGAWLLRSVIALRHIIRTRQVRLVHSCTLAVVPGALAARLSGTPHIWHIHETLTRPAWFARLSALLAARLGGDVVAVAHGVRDNLIRLCPDCRHNSRVIYNGIDPASWLAPPDSRAATRRSLGIDRQAPLITCIGRLSRLKGQACLLAALPRVLAAYPDARLLLVGDPVPGDTQIRVQLTQTIEQLHLEHAVRLTGYRRDIPALLAASDVLVQASVLPDSLPTTVMEAMAAGRPVIATDIGGSRELICDGRTGLLVPPQQPVPMAEAICRLIADGDLRRQLASAAAERVQRTFSRAAFARHWQQVYTELAFGHAHD